MEENKKTTIQAPEAEPTLQQVASQGESTETLLIRSSSEDDASSAASSALPTPASVGEGELLENERRLVADADDVKTEVDKIGGKKDRKGDVEENLEENRKNVTASDLTAPSEKSKGDRGLEKSELDSIVPTPTATTALSDYNDEKAPSMTQDIPPQPFPAFTPYKQNQKALSSTLNKSPPPPPPPQPSYSLPYSNPQPSQKPPLQLYNQPSGPTPHLYTQSSPYASPYSSISSNRQNLRTRLSTELHPTGYTQDPHAMDLPGVLHNPRNDYFNKPPYNDAYDQNVDGGTISTSGPNRGGDVGLVAGLMYLWEKGWEKGAGLLEEIWDGGDDTGRRG